MEHWRRFKWTAAAPCLPGSRPSSALRLPRPAGASRFPVVGNRRRTRPDGRVLLAIAPPRRLWTDESLPDPQPSTGARLAIAIGLALLSLVTVVAAAGDIGAVGRVSLVFIPTPLSRTHAGAAKYRWPASRRHAWHVAAKPARPPNMPSPTGLTRRHLRRTVRSQGCESPESRRMGCSSERGRVTAL